MIQISNIKFFFDKKKRKDDGISKENASLIVMCQQT